ncbi:hypothetical protein WN982_31780 [Paraburkholderia sp. IMGN_8]|uniref:hypothetical protein n=1 Tax=Paraburkholderia sp. IMGN_8 TaxID=3136564 RepID=UPI003100C4AF
MATNITITKGGRAARQSPRKLPGWLWFIALWCFGVASAMSLGYAFKLLMNATLFAVK